MLSFPTVLGNTCESFCEKTYQGKAQSGVTRPWFCLGLWSHFGKFYGGCNFWKGYWGMQLNRAEALEKCEAECDAAGYTKSLKLLNGDSSTETLSCKEGCKRGGLSFLNL